MSLRFQSRLNRLAYVSYDLARAVGSGSAQPNREVRTFAEGQTNMDVSGTGSVSGGSPVRGASSVPTQPVAPPAASMPHDDLDIPPAEKMLDRHSETPERRAERLAQIKESIENGDYDTDEKLDAALSRMFESLGIDLDEE